MKYTIVSILILFLVVPSYAGDNDNAKNSLLYVNYFDANYFDPGHRKKQKDEYAFEVYFGLQPSAAFKLNFAFTDTQTEKMYMMLGMDFDSDMYAKFGWCLNHGKRNKNKSLSAQSFGWWRLWRYVMIRKAIEIGYKGHFLDGDAVVQGSGTTFSPAIYVNGDGELSKNYGGLTANYTWIFDGNFLFDKTAWYFFDHRTARRIRLKIDAGVFMNLNKFRSPHLGSFSGSSDSNTYQANENEIDQYGDPIIMTTYPVVSPFVHFSIGFAF